MRYITRSRQIKNEVGRGALIKERVIGAWKLLE